MSSLAERFMAKVEKTDTCWLWTGAVAAATGYGRFYTAANPPVDSAHRVAHRLFIGPIAAGLDVDHLCSVRNCVNPDHLEAVTRLENIQRVYRGQTHCNNGHELTPDNLVTSHPRRTCKTCARERARAWRAARSTARVAS